MKKNIQNEIKKTINGLANAFDQEEIEKARLENQETIDLYAEVATAINPVEDFYYRISFPNERKTSGLLKINNIQNEKAIWVLTHADFIENQFKKMIVKYEGSPCSADKSRTIMRRLFFFYHLGQNIIFDYNGEYTYHLPKTIFKTEESIIAFFDAIMSLYYGDPTKYLEQLKNLLSNFKEIE